MSRLEGSTQKIATEDNDEEEKADSGGGGSARTMCTSKKTGYVTGTPHRRSHKAARTMCNARAVDGCIAVLSSTPTKQMVVFRRKSGAWLRELQTINADFWQTSSKSSAAKSART